MGARSKARKRALDVLFEADVRGEDTVGTLARRLAAADPPVPEYAVELVEGVSGARDRIDALLRRYAEGWTLERMPPVDRNVLRLGAYELVWCDDVPDAVAVSEAVELVSALSTEESPRFVNGVLSRLAADRDARSALRAVEGSVALPATEGSVALRATDSSDAGVERLARLGGEDPPRDELLGQHSGSGVVDHSQ